MKTKLELFLEKQGLTELFIRRYEEGFVGANHSFRAFINSLNPKGDKDAIEEAFAWGNTPEGFIYWNKVSKAYKRFVENTLV